MTKKEYKLMKLEDQLENRSHNMLIHGYLLAVQSYVLAFKLEGTAAFVLRYSGMLKEDLIRCQLENGHENETMLRIIDKAFELK